MDPDRAAVMVVNIAAALSTADPGNARLYEANAQAYQEELTALAAELRQQLAGLGRRSSSPSTRASATLPTPWA